MKRFCRCGKEIVRAKHATTAVRCTDCQEQRNVEQKKWRQRIYVARRVKERDQSDTTMRCFKCNRAYAPEQHVGIFFCSTRCERWVMGRRTCHERVRAAGRVQPTLRLGERSETQEAVHVNVQ